MYLKHVNVTKQVCVFVLRYTSLMSKLDAFPSLDSPGHRARIFT
jgi:hypothetical protein